MGTLSSYINKVENGPMLMSFFVHGQHFFYFLKVTFFLQDQVVQVDLVICR